MVSTPNLAITSQRVITPQEERAAAILIRGEKILDIISISESYNVAAKIIGRVEESQKKKLTIRSEFGEFEYN